MKRITLIVPDQVTCIYGDNVLTESKRLITKEIVMKMLSKRADYHEEYYYDDTRRVTILIEESREGAFPRRE